MSCSSHFEEETHILKSSALALLLNYLDSLNLQYMWTQNLKNVFSDLFLSCATSSLYSWQSLASKQPQKLTNLGIYINDITQCTLFFHMLFNLYLGSLCVQVFFPLLLIFYFCLHFIYCSLMAYDTIKTYGTKSFLLKHMRSYQPFTMTFIATAFVKIVSEICCTEQKLLPKTNLLNLKLNFF